MVYMLRITPPLGTSKHRARFYLGYCADDRLHERLAEHRAGAGAAMTRAAAERGHDISVVQTWPGLTRKDERRMKRRKCHARLLRGVQP